MNPSAKQLQAIPESLHKQQMFRALGLEQKEEWFSTSFWFPTGETLQFTGEGLVYFHPDPANKGSRFLPLSEVPRFIRWPAGTPTGDALRAYLRRWGWLPKGELPVTAPQENTKTVI